jgi:hypothetical protein
MYSINFEFFKSSKLTNDHLKIENLKKKLWFKISYDITIDINNILSHYLTQQIDVFNFLSQIQ